MDLGRQTNMTEVRAIIGMDKYYRDMWPMWYLILDSLIYAASGHKGIKILWNYGLGDFSKSLMCMTSSETLLNYPDWEFYFAVHTDYYDKKVGCCYYSE